MQDEQNRTGDAPQGDMSPADQSNQVDQSGRLPGGGVGRREEPGQTGVYPLSADASASGDAPIQGEAAWGQGERGAAGYQDTGGSGLLATDETADETAQ